MILDALRECWIKTGSVAVLAYEAWRTGGTDGICRTHVPPAATIRFRMGSWSRATQLAVGCAGGPGAGGCHPAHPTDRTQTEGLHHDDRPPPP